MKYAPYMYKPKTWEEYEEIIEGLNDRLGREGEWEEKTYDLEDEILDLQNQVYELRDQLEIAKEINDELRQEIGELLELRQVRDSLVQSIKEMS